jgi:preprotein translocase subunit SecF
MEFFKNRTHYDFMGQSRPAFFVSLLLVVLSVISLGVRGLNVGLDFSGGTLIEIAYPQPVEVEPLRQALSAAGFAQALVQHMGAANEVQVRLGVKFAGGNEATLSNRVLQTLSLEATNPPNLLRAEYVGAQVGDELAQDGGLAVLYAVIAILIYVAWRFEWRFALGSVLALLHDVVIVVGLFSLFQWDFDLTVLAAVLAVIGYSINDTIVVFDRIRENMLNRRLRKESVYAVMNISLNETLSRTLMTGVTTLMVLLALFIWGGPVVHNFALCLILGLVIGTYSSVYVASAYVLWLGVSHNDLLVEKVEVEDGRP